MGKKWTPGQIVHLLKTNDIFLERALVKLFERQTNDEKAVSDSKHTNGRGFNKPDSRRCTIYAKTVLKNKGKQVPEGQRLLDWQREDARPRILKYTGQLAEIANEQK